MKKEVSEKKSEGLKALFVSIGVVATIGAFLAILYGIFRKFFKISIECGNEGDAFDDEFDDLEPACDEYCGYDPDVTLAEDAEIFGSDKENDEEGE